VSEPAAALAEPPAAQRLSFEAFFEAEHVRLYRALTLMTANAHEAEELMQDAFLKLLERWDRVDAMDNPTGYLYRAAMNLFRNRRRRLRLDLRLRHPREDERDPFVQVAARDEAARALALLTPRQRAALVLTDMLEFDSNEAGEMLRIKPATVRVLAHQARESIRSRTEREDD
jgi:RNA polymerase sigma-70 factor (ECF subfamily)